LFSLIRWIVDQRAARATRPGRAWTGSYNGAMNALFRPAAVLLAALSAALPLAAQTDAAQRQLPPEPNVQHVVVEDEGVRVEELRVRGQTQRIHVQPRKGAAYEVVPESGARDMSAGPGSSRGAVGQRVWNVFNF
jgi:hypothetical protein